MESQQKQLNRVASVLMTPEWAAKLLANKAPNRRLSKQLVNAIADDIMNGRYDSSVVQPFRVNSLGILTDGQHRLSAIVQCGIAVQMWMEVSDSDKFDIGISRTAANLLTFGGVERSNQAAAATRVILTCFKMRESNTRWNEWAMNVHGRFTRSEVANAYKSFDGLEAILRDARTIYDLQPRYAKLFGPSTAAAFIYIASMDLGDGSFPRAILEEIAKGEGLEAGDPILAYRKFAAGMSAQERNPVEFACMMFVARAILGSRTVNLMRHSSYGDVLKLQVV